MLTLIQGGSYLIAQRSDEDAVNVKEVAFSIKSPGVKRSLNTWGLDTALPDPNNVRRGQIFMGNDQVDLIRVSFPINEPLVNGDFPPSKDTHFTTRLNIAKLAGDKPFTMLPDTDMGVHAWFKDGNDVNPGRWVQLIAAAQKRYGKTMKSIEVFNEADWGWGQGSAENLGKILTALKEHPDFKDTLIAGPSTLSADASNRWYGILKPQLDIATTHSLGGSFENYINFYRTAAAEGKVTMNPEVHNLVEVISGAEYGMQGAIWWGAPERARGAFVHAVQGVQLAYAEDLLRWSAAGVYRTQDGKIQAFAGCSERSGSTTSFKFISRDRPVFFNGDGPRREYTVTARKDTEYLVNITWGQDVQPLVGGKYVIVNRKSHKVLGVVDGNKNNGAKVAQMDYTRGENQQWEITPVNTQFGDQSYYELRAVHSGRTMDDTDWSLDEGTKVQIWGSGDNIPQQWFLDYAGDNYFFIRNRCSAMYLEIENGSDAAGALAQQTGHFDAPQQQWRLIPVSDFQIDFDAPQAPADVSAAIKPLGVTLNWAVNHEPDIATYTIYRSIVAGGPYDTIARGLKGNQFIDNEAKDSGTIYYVVKAIDHSFNSSDFSMEVAIKR